MEKFDYIVIGGGSAGIASANRAAEYGAKSLIIEENEVGGTCVNVGCVPKKISWYGSEIADDISLYARDYGFDLDIENFDYEVLKRNREAYIDRTHLSYFKGFESRGTHYLHGHAEFVNNHTVRVDGQEYTADHISVVTGCHPLLPKDVKGIEMAETSDDFFQWEDLPESVVIVGAGYIAVEFACMLNSLGVETTVVFRHDSLMREFEAYTVETLMDEMRKAGIYLIPNHHPVAIEVAGDGLELQCEEGDSFLGEKILYAIGREPNTRNLGLENTDIELDERGFIKTNQYHQTNVPGLYAFGDVVGKVELTPVAIKAGRTLADTLFNGAEPYKIDEDTIPTVVFTHPPMGKIGLTEEEAKERYGDDQIKTYKSQFTSMKTGTTSHPQKCRVKMVTRGDKEQVIGLHAIGQGVDEMMQGFAVAIHMGATKKDFDDTIAIHPTTAEEVVTLR